MLARLFQREGGEEQGSRAGGLWMRLELGSAEPAKALRRRFPVQPGALVP